MLIVEWWYYSTGLNHGLVQYKLKVIASRNYDLMLQRMHAPLGQEKFTCILKVWNTNGEANINKQTGNIY